jgi:hypothetical protein
MDSAEGFTEKLKSGGGGGPEVPPPPQPKLAPRTNKSKQEAASGFRAILSSRCLVLMLDTAVLAFRDTDLRVLPQLTVKFMFVECLIAPEVAVTVTV